MIKVALLGDSITEYMPYRIDNNMKHEFNDPMTSDELPQDIIFYVCGVSNIGVGTYHEYIWKDVKKDEIDCFALLLGINNIIRPDCDYDGLESLYHTVEKLKKFINDIYITGKRLIVESIYPVYDIETNKNIKYVNSEIKKYCLENNIEFLDLWDILIGPDNIINLNYVIDGLHPNKEGYMLIIKEIRKKVLSTPSRKLTKDNKDS